MTKYTADFVKSERNMFQALMTIILLLLGVDREYLIEVWDAVTAIRDSHEESELLDYVYDMAQRNIPYVLGQIYPIDSYKVNGVSFDFYEKLGNKILDIFRFAEVGITVYCYWKWGVQSWFWYSGWYLVMIWIPSFVCFWFIYFFSKYLQKFIVKMFMMGILYRKRNQKRSLDKKIELSK